MVFQKETPLYKSYIISISLLIGLLLSAVFFGMNLRTRSLIMDELLSHARAYFETIVATRLWNANYGGVYVEKKDGVQSSPYLQNPNIETKDGRVFTMRNPAMMTRELSEIIGINRDFRFHITSNRLTNPNNKPDGFEQRALDLFERGQKEINEINSKNNHLYFRYMGVLFTTKGCLNCHAGQGYKEGDVRGGISVTFNIDTVDKKLKANTWFIIIFGISTTFFLIATLWYLTRRLMNKIIDARKEIEDKNKKLEELDQLKNKFLGIVVHDMRNPLSSIRGFSEIMLGESTGKLNEEQKEFVGIIYNASDAMLQLVNNLLDFSAIESGKLDLNVKRGSLKKLLEVKIKMDKVIAEKKGIAIHSSLSDIPDALFDANLIGQVIDNLISNAIKFSPANSNMYISLSQKERMAEVSVRDEGPGLAPEDLSKLFGEFQKLCAMPTEGERSTGLGLSIVKKIVEAHKGAITVESTPGAGAKFTVAIPLVESDPI